MSEDPLYHSQEFFFREVKLHLIDHHVCPLQVPYLGRSAGTLWDDVVDLCVQSQSKGQPAVRTTTLLPVEQVLQLVRPLGRLECPG